MFDIFPELEKLAPVADIIAKYSNWPSLYDEWQLARNEVPLYALTYVDDMYVDFTLAQETVRLVANCRQYITNSLYHNALKQRTTEALEVRYGIESFVLPSGAHVSYTPEGLTPIDFCAQMLIVSMLVGTFLT